MYKESELYCRYNGTMLGFFLTGSYAELTVHEFPRLLKRMQEFLEEIGALPILPSNREHFISGHAHLTKEVIFSVHSESELLGKFALLGATAMNYVLQSSVNKQLASQLREQASEYLADIQIPDSILDKFLERANRKGQGIDLNSLHSSSLEFLRKIIDPIPAETKTAFISMPFSLEEHYLTFYVPFLQDLGYCGFRAWGGMAHEDYQELMITLLRKSKCVLADLTGLNINVIYEMGVAHGMGKIVFPIVDESQQQVPSNFGDLAIVNYNSSDLQESIQSSSLMLSLMQLGEDLEQEKT